MKVFSTATGKFTRLAFLALFAFLLGQKEASSQFCNAAFTYTINQTQGLIYFTPNDMDSLGTHYWNLGGTISTLRQPTRAMFTAPGNYMIVHAFSKPGCARDTSVQFITIANTTCNANFNHSVNNATLQVTFVSTDTLPNATHLWTFGGQGSSTLPALVKQFSSAGTYYVTHIISRGACRDTVSKWITVGSQPCLAGFTYSVDSFGMVHFTNTSTPSSNNPPYPLNYFWTFGSNNATSTQKNPSFNYPAGGWYVVCLVVSKLDSSCTKTFCDTIYLGPVNPPPPVCNANFTATVNSSNRKKFHFTNTSKFDSLSRIPVQFSWTFGDGDSAVGYAPNHTYAAAGTYQVCLTVKQGTCQNTICKPIVVTVSDTCKAGFTYTVDSIGTVLFTNTSTPNDNPPFDTLTYAWDFGDGNLSNQKNPWHTFLANAWYSVCLMVSKPDSSCTDVFCDTIYAGPINSPSCHANFNFTVDNSNPKKIHFANTSTFDSLTRLPILSIWSFGDGDSAVGFNQQHTYATAGTYQVCLTIKQGNCQHTKCTYVTVQAPTNCNASFTYSLYADSIDGTKRIVMFNNTSNSAGVSMVQWSFGDSTWSTMNSPTHYYPVNGMYTVCLSILGLDSCQDDTCVTIAIMPDSSTGLSPVSGLEHIRYYPVPMDGVLHLDLSTENRLDYQITISNTLGVPVIQTQGKAEQRQVDVDVAELPAGIYLITLSNKLGSVTKRLMK